MEVLSPSATNGTGPPPVLEPPDPLAVLEHIASLIETSLGTARRELEAVGSLLSESKRAGTIEKVTQFSTESQPALYAHKDRRDELVNGHDDTPRIEHVYTISSEFSASRSTVSSIVFLKQAVSLDGSRPIAQQINATVLPSSAIPDEDGPSETTGASPFEVLHSLLHNVVTPYFESYTRSQTSAGRMWYDSEAKSGIPGARRRLGELEMSLLHLQQNTDIPMVNLSMHPIVADVLQQAEAAGKTPSISMIPAHVLDDSKVLNSVQSQVNNWVKSIQGITKLVKDSECGSAAQEINFWLSLESALSRVEKSLQSPGVLLTLDILNNGKRFQAGISLNQDTNLAPAQTTVHNYNVLMRDFPLDELSSATSLVRVQEALTQIFNHINKKLRLSSNYPVKRALKLVEGISEDLNIQIHRVLRGKPLLSLTYAAFQDIVRAADSIWATWEESVREFTAIARDLIRKRNTEFVPIKINPRHVQTQERIKYVRTFRRNHEQLQKTIASVLGPKSGPDSMSRPGSSDGVAILEDIGDVDAVQEVANAYNAIREVDVLDTSPDGTEIWVQAELQYTERTSRVENSIIARLRDRLATAKTAGEMFRVFAKFNALLVRPKVRGAIGEYQAQLLDNVKNDIAALHERYKAQYGGSETQMMAQLRDIPPVAGSILWVRQIENQLNILMKKVEAVLGQDWTLHADGAKLHAESDLFRKKLTTRTIYEAWLADVQRRNLQISGRLFSITRARGATGALEFGVNFDNHVISLFKEVRNLTWLNFQIPHAISNVSKEAQRVYPFALSLMESVTAYLAVSRTIQSMPEVSQLLIGYERDVQLLFSKGVPLRWESFVHIYELPQEKANGDGSSSVVRSDSKHVQYVRDLSAAISVLQSKTWTLQEISKNITLAMNEMKSCAYSFKTFEAHFDTVQNGVDKLNLENYAHLNSWVKKLNSDLRIILQDRLDTALEYWTKSFSSTSQGEVFQAQPQEGDVHQISFPRIEIGILMNNQTIFTEPPLNHVKASWLVNLEEYLNVLCHLRLIKASRYQMSAAASLVQTDATFANLVQGSVSSLQTAFDAVDSKLGDMSLYLEEWYRYQSLWDLRSDNIAEALGEDLTQWHQLLQEIRDARSTFDTSGDQKDFGTVSFNYKQIQAKITQKYDQWQYDVTMQFGKLLGGRMSEVFSDLKRSRADLENQSLETSSTAQAVAFITIVQQCKRNATLWEPEIEVFRQGQTALSRQRYNFASDWLSANQISDEWSAFEEILNRTARLVEEQTDALRAKIAAEDTLISARVKETALQWQDERPISGTIPPDEASALLRSFQTKFEKLQSELETVSRAKEALGLPFTKDDDLAATIEEVHDFQSVWSALSTIWQSINELRESLWSSVQPRKIRQSLEGLVKMAKEMPSRMRQYAAFEHVQNVLRQFIKANSLLGELKSDAIRERHWAKIFKALKPSKRYSEISMTLGDVWDLQLVSSESIIKDIILQAQGELALEEFVKQVRDTWQNYSLDLVMYQSKTRLIRGWDDLFTKCSENLNSLQAMRHSPYYKEFEEEASSWEDKLNRVHVLFDVWIDVQRQWVYLEGVFIGNQEIQHLLPTESSRFSNINTEFTTIMKKVTKSPFVMDVLGIPGVQKSLERLADLLSKIQKALGEYLERERVQFPRFYFVGDEDLLEIIGNSNDTTRVAKHFKKMFAGISGAEVNDDNIITAISSKEGEVVPLKKEVSLIKLPKINDWLTALDNNVKATLAELLAEAFTEFESIFQSPELNVDQFVGYLTKFPTQIAILGAQAVWTKLVQTSLEAAGADLSKLYDAEVRILEMLAESVLQDLPALTRRKCEQFITEAVHQRDVIARLMKAEANTPGHHLWILCMRYVYNPEAEPLDRLTVEMANARLHYGYEYLGAPDRLRLGGSPYGPAGTGKTESVKALGLQLGRFTLVFCCDDTFDFQAMGRIFLGICQVGAWGCFDEFNRLEERILSAVSQQIQNIQIGLRNSTNEQKAQIELVGRRFRVNQNSGLFITMNPGYAGRSNLPDNLKKLFRSVAMSKPDKELIAEVMLFSQGFKQAKAVSKQVVPFFDHCARALSKQPHYDFGLRALKSVLVSSGGLKRMHVQAQASGEATAEITEPQIIVQSIRETVSPKLIKSDVEQLVDVQQQEFPGVEYVPADLTKLKTAIAEVMKEQNLTPTEAWMTKIIQLYQIQNIHHGVMMVGPSASGKTSVWRVLQQALQRVDGIEGVHHLIDPKVMSKEALYGSLDSTTREWTDGLFTATLRRIVDNLRGEDSKRHWIIFDGEVDPVWVENLNSVLDDNKLLTLPNGERLNLPSNVRIMFEVESLKYATLATVSRCGMVWFSDDTVTPSLMIDYYLRNIASRSFDDIDEDIGTGSAPAKVQNTQLQIVGVLRALLERNDFLLKALEQAAVYKHIMEFTVARALDSFFSLLVKTCRHILQYNVNHPEFPLDDEQVEAYVAKELLLATVWALVGDASLAIRKSFGDYIATLTNTEVPTLDDSTSLIDYDATLPQAQWTPWQSQVPTIEVNTHSITQTDVIIPTVDTVRHEDVLYSWLAEHKPLMLCGPPGSGKTMTLFSALRKLPDMEVVGLNFSSATQPDLIVKTFEQYCEYRKTLNGMVLSPTQIGKWLVIFCDEINLPAPDTYGTQRAISFLRQLIEQNGFWRTSDKVWVSLERIQFVGACNPPEDAGRHAMGTRFLRHAPVVMVDYPGEMSLHQIYGTFNNAVLKVIPSLRGFADAMTRAMVGFFLQSQARFTADIQPHYVYSPRELTRWVRGVYEAISPLEQLSQEGLIRVWAHEALRLFSDRLVTQEERDWTSDMVRQTALEHFPSANIDSALHGPILFSNWLSRNYVSVEQEQLREFVKARLKTFCEEEVDVPLVLFNDVLEHALRIDRVFRQPQGHLILIGTSGSGKTTLSRFVAWMNGLSVFQIKVHGKYSAEDFDDDLRNVLRRCGTQGQKLCFIMDESNVLDSGFLERMNTLLANGEVPGLFEGDEYASLMTACKEGAQRQGLLLDSQEELYKWFTQQIVRNLHVVFTMNPPQEGLSSKAATSPALFNRCVLNWMGDWSDQALYQVGFELTQSLDLDKANFQSPDSIPVAYSGLQLPASHRDSIVNAMVYIHYSIHKINMRLEKQQGMITYLTPRHYLDFVAHFVKLFREKREDLEDQQRHLNVGLDKLKDTVDKVRDLRVSLAQKKTQLEAKDAEANEKLQRMVADQREAETRKAASLEIQAALEIQEKEVAERKEIVLNDLAKAEPAVLEAQRSVSNIKRQHLTEVRSMANPPNGVKLALESVCTLLGNKVDGWKTIQGIVRREDFIASIVNYDNEAQMTAALREKMTREFLSNDDFTFERVNRASKACGPLVQWVQAQVNYSSILDRVGPLRAEVEKLEDQALTTKAEAKAIENTILKLEQSIATYKTEYAALISETQEIKTEMSRVQTKVDRSVRLLDSLSSERGRWEDGSRSFETQIQTLIGDVVIASAFLAYAGLYDQQFRKAMVDDWLHQLAQSGIACKSDASVLGYMSTADERLQWQRNTLPGDDLCMENAIMVKRFNRYPLIIDPSSRVTEFLKREHEGCKLTVTSFLDDAFTKQLESALRFGNPILIQDAEYLDPILTHVLNKEYQKTGGRVLIQLGKQEIDFSPSFRLYLSTRDPSARFAPDVCSRTTFVNFTVTQSSLRTQSLNEVLKSERPDVDKRRTNLIKMQGDFNTNLRQLEKRLLQALNESRGNILDDDNVIQTLETLKKEAAVISKKMKETEGVMTEVERITEDYGWIANACSAIFAILEQLYHLNHTYRFSLQYFTDIFSEVLTKAKNMGDEKDHRKRGESILKNLFVETFQRTSLSLLQKDRIALAVLLIRATPYEFDRSILELVLDERPTSSSSSKQSDTMKDIVAKIQRQPPFKGAVVDERSKDWLQFMSAERAERYVPQLWQSNNNTIDDELLRLLVVKIARPDRFMPAAQNLVKQVFGTEILAGDDSLSLIVQQVNSIVPIALMSSPGFDASYKVDALVEKQNASCANVAMGSEESVASADKAITSAAANGTWVLIKNVHLAPQWLQSLEKRLTAVKPHDDFRIFLSMEASPKIPVNLIRASRALVYEQPAGMRANMKDTLAVLSDRGTQAPVEKGRLYLLLCFLHAILQERLRYAPTLGWKGFWEFNDSDYECCAFIIDTWIEHVAQGRSNVAPVKLPWDLIRTLIMEMYGGKIDDEGDFGLLGDLVRKIFDPAAYENEHALVSEASTEPLKVPSGTTIKDFMGWVDQLPEREPPAYLGLPDNADKLLLVGQGKETIQNLARVSDLLEEGEELASAPAGEP
ncbi:Dynein heavy chain, cytoplasmic [Cyphellophora attinorum]|uniref:Dynein heavy chain, cytoplasmic n=1 Tax=Cyphellophora attinorum TaxID=1664694 RepID=A0A0N1NZ85_9EURO|nr:Dynein heavy chain, cytoplasmic [Phialophora attinorum]KPI38240.1 Dynein heavy chain, cytoplasmic [Phialophora attinorum]